MTNTSLIAEAVKERVSMPDAYGMERSKELLQKQKRFILICTHNPQDFFNGSEPDELSKIYETSRIEKSVFEEIKNGYQVIVMEVKNENN